MRRGRGAAPLLVLIVAATAGACGGGAGEPVPKRFSSEQARIHGRELFVTHCALCHGRKADGRGVRRASLSRPPADFTHSAWKRGKTPRQVFEIIENGKPGTSMPSWKALPRADVWDLAAYVWSVSEEGP